MGVAGGVENAVISLLAAEAHVKTRNKKCQTRRLQKPVIPVNRCPLKLRPELCRHDSQFAHDAIVVRLSVGVGF